MAAVYRTETLIQHDHGQDILVENLTPVYPPDEREDVKKELEERLYEVFCKCALD